MPPQMRVQEHAVHKQRDRSSALLDVGDTTGGRLNRSIGCQGLTACPSLSSLSVPQRTPALPLAGPRRTNLNDLRHQAVGCSSVLGTLGIIAVWLSSENTHLLRSRDASGRCLARVVMSTTNLRLDIGKCGHSVSDSYRTQSEGRSWQKLRSNSNTRWCDGGRTGRQAVRHRVSSHAVRAGRWRTSSARAGRRITPSKNGTRVTRSRSSWPGVFKYRSTVDRGLMTPGSLLLGNHGQSFECGHQHGEGDRCVSFWYEPEYFERLVADAGAGRRQLGFSVPRLPPSPRLSPLVARAGAGVLGAAGVTWEELAVSLGARTFRLAAGDSSSETSSPPNAEGRRDPSGSHD